MISTYELFNRWIFSPDEWLSWVWPDDGSVGGNWDWSNFGFEPERARRGLVENNWPLPIDLIKYDMIKWTIIYFFVYLAAVAPFVSYSISRPDCE